MTGLLIVSLPHLQHEKDASHINIQQTWWIQENTQVL